MVGYEILQKRRAGGGNLRICLFEVAGIIGVGYVLLRGEKVAELENFLPVPARGQADDIGHVHVVHDKDVIGIFDIGKGYGAGTVQKAVHAVIFKGARRRRIDGVALLVVGGRKGLHAEKRG